MNAEAAAPEFKRILVTLEADAGGRAALDAAGRLAAAFKAELVGLFVEDTELLAAADLPVTRSVSRHGGRQFPVDARVMARALRVSAVKAGDELAAVATARQVRWSYRVIRGTVAEQVADEARGCDLVLIGSSDRNVLRARLAAAAQILAQEGPCSVMLMRGVWLPNRPVVALYDGAGRALAVGERLSSIYGRGLRVLAVADSVGQADALARDARDWLAAERHPAEVRTLGATGAAEVCDAVRHDYPGLLVIDRRGAVGGDMPFADLIDRLGCSVFLIR